MSIPGYNIQVSASQEYKSELWSYVRDGTPAVTFPAINDISDVTADFFRTIHDEAAIERLFKSWDAQGRTYKMWSFYADKPAGEVQTIRNDLDALVLADPDDFAVMGAWSCVDGWEVGTAGGTNPAGVWYSIPSQYIKFMQDIVTDPGDPEAEPPVPPTTVPATDPTDTNLLFGQAPRSFSSYYA